MGENASERGWKRAQLTLRLPAERIAQLRAVASKMEPGATPTDAVDRAIAMAAAQLAAEPANARLDALEDELGAMAMERRFDTDRIEAAISELGQNLAQLHALISAIASQAADDY